MINKELSGDITFFKFPNIKFIKTMTMPTCSYKACTEKVNESKHINGEIYCNDHYSKLLNNQLQNAYQSWKHDNEVPRKFRVLLARISDEEGWDAEEDSYLSQARIRDRAYSFKKTSDGCEFKIERHLNAWSGKGQKRNVIERWRANIENKTLELLETEEVED